jgi:hypothetical protein
MMSAMAIFHQQWDAVRARHGVKKKSAESIDSALVYRFATLTCNYAAMAIFRSDLKPTRISSEKSCGCSHAAKCPPFSTLL